MLQLDYRDARPIYAQICDGFREEIVTGVLQPGDQLPSVRELATQLAINPNTIHRSYRELEIQGWIATVPGKGCFVSGVPSYNRVEQERMLKELDTLVNRLLALGTSSQEIRQCFEGAMQRTQEQGGKDNA